MADIKMLLQNYVGQDDDQADDDDYRKYYESSMIETTDLLSPLEKLHKYCTSENIFTRQMVARSIVETVQSLTTEQECLSLLEIITKLSDDIEPSVRCELMEHLPPCSMMIMDMKIIPDAISTFILPVMVRYLTDANNQVRKLSQNALLQLMDQDLIKKDDVESQICPVILVLTEPESDDDFRTEAVALMTKITCLLGAELTEKLFLERFGKLCGDALFHVRKVCASNFGEIAAVVKRETTERHLLQFFAHLCRDGVWGVRKACAESFMAVSSICSLQVRYQMLSPLFVGLLCDKSRWVQMQAYQVLGQFIATFAEPENSGFRVTDDGVLVQFLDCNSKLLGSNSENAELSSFGRSSSFDSDGLVLTDSACSPEASCTTSDLSCEPLSPDDSSHTFNAFTYWRVPLPTVDLPDELVDQTSEVKAETLSQTNNENANDGRNVLPQGLDTTIPGEAVKTYVIINSSTVENKENNENSENMSCLESFDTNDNDNYNCENEDSEQEPVDVHNIDIHIENYCNNNSSNTLEKSKHNENDILLIDGAFESVHDFYLQRSEDENSEEENSTQSISHYSTILIANQTLHCQKIVPPALLEHFISMTEPSKANYIDGDLPRHCAFTLPGVVLALGRDNWHLLRDTYIHLSTDMQWKVRRTLAFSIHDLALILGQKICVEDLVPVFNQFLKDLDEVRVGVLKHLFQFIGILSKEQQKDYLPIFCEFQKTDNSRNWRFRKDLSEQLISLVELYTEEELSDYLCPVALQLASDKVADVRETSFDLLTVLLQKLYKYQDAHLFHKFVTTIVTLGFHHQHWVKRKACVQIYSKFLDMEWYDKSHFVRDFLPSLLNLCADVVPNIRLISSKALLCLVKSSYYQSLPEADEVRKHVDCAVENLQLDDDRDVRFFSGGKVEEQVSSNTVLEDTIPFDKDGDLCYLAGGNVDDKFQNMTLEMGLDDNDSFSYSHGVQIIQRGIHDYAINDDDDDDDAELVEEVYIEDTLQGTSNGDMTME